MIIEAATGNPVEQELENRIIGPLHLDSTYLVLLRKSGEHLLKQEVFYGTRN